MTALVSALGLDAMQKFFEQLPDVAEASAVLAINQVADRDGLNLIKSTMRSQVNFPVGYLEDGRLAVKSRANRSNLQAVISGRDRPTSLARFAAGQDESNTRGRGVRVTIKGGRTVTLKKAFIINLKDGNRGVAIPLPEGQAPSSSQGAKRIGRGMWLLYGPSVDQVFAGVADQVLPDLGQMLSNQFLRQFARLTRG